MKKTLIVLGFAMCSTLAMGQSTSLMQQLNQPKKVAEALSTEQVAPVDYKGSIFTKAAGDVLGTFTFSASDMATRVVINTITTSDQIDGANVAAAASHQRSEPIFKWRRIADTNTVRTPEFASTYPGLSNYFADVATTVSSFMGPDNNVEGNDGFMMLDITEENYNQQAINTYFALEAVTLNGDVMIDVQWRQLYRKYYDKCYVDYTVNGAWKSFEVNVTGVDCDVTGLAPAFMIAALPTEAANQSSVQVRFRLSADGTLPYGYYWFVDDVKIVATPTDRWTFSNFGYLNGFYGMLPEGFSVPLSFAAYGRNTGLNARNNVSLAGMHRQGLEGTWESTPFINVAHANMPGMTPNVRYKMILDESGYMAPNQGFDEDTYIAHTVPDYYSYYGTNDATLAAAGYNRIGLPATGIGAHQYTLQFRSGDEVYELDTMTYTVSENMEIGAQDSAMGRTVPGYRWSNDNGLIPSMSEFAYQFTSGSDYGYVSPGANGETHQYANGYIALVRYNTPSVIPTDANGEPWRFRGLEFVTSTKLTSAEVEGSIIEPYAVVYRFGGETTPDGGTYRDTGFYLMGTGVDEERFQIGPESAPLEPVTGALLPDQPYYAYNVFFPEQPVIEPNRFYRFGYTNLSDGTRFAVARTSYTYANTDSTSARYTANEEYAPYYNQVTPTSKIYDAFAYDPLQASRNDATYHSIFGWNIDYYPMIRVIVGPKLTIPNYGIFGECSGQDDSLYTITNGDMYICGVADSVPEGASRGYWIFPGRVGEQDQYDDNNYYIYDETQEFMPRSVITDITLDGVSIINDTNLVQSEDYTVYWGGHTPADEVAWEPALQRSYYYVTVRRVNADHRLAAVTELRALGIGDVEDNVSMTLAPNPATSMVNVDIKGFGGKATCSIIDMSGRVVLNTEISEGNTNISLNGIAAGAYFVRVTNAAFSKVEKLIVR